MLPLSRPAAAAASALLAVCLLPAACGGNGRVAGHPRGRAKAQLHAAVVTTTTARPTPPGESTTAAPPGDPTTSAPASNPTTPSTPSTQAPPAPPAPAGSPADPALEGDASQPPPASVVVPPSEFIGTGLPKPGSFFRSLTDDHSLDGKGKFVALTFDDGPGPFTRRIVDVLNVFGVKATFFQIGNQTAGRPELVRYMVASGMHLGSHSRGHVHLPTAPPLQQYDEIVGASDLQDSIAGAGTTKCFRPPYGQYDQSTLNAIAARGLATAMWSVDTDDWMKPGLPTIVVRALDAVKDRSIILMHDGGGDRAQTIEALPWIIVALQRRGFTFVPIC